MTDWKKIPKYLQNHKASAYRIHMKTSYDSMRKDKNTKMNKVYEDNSESKMANMYEKTHLINNKGNQTETLTFLHVRLAKY